jgi:hypothetical protein
MACRVSGRNGCAEAVDKGANGALGTKKGFLLQRLQRNPPGWERRRAAAWAGWAMCAQNVQWTIDNNDGTHSIVFIVHALQECALISGVIQDVSKLSVWDILGLGKTYKTRRLQGYLDPAKQRSGSCSNSSKQQVGQNGRKAIRTSNGIEMFGYNERWGRKRSNKL